MENKFITKEEARQQNLSFYFTGIACRAGHIAPRYVSNGGCQECVRSKNPKANFDARIHFEAEKDLKARLVKYAKSKGLTVAEYMRKLLDNILPNL